VKLPAVSIHKPVAAPETGQISGKCGTAVTPNGAKAPQWRKTGVVQQKFADARSDMPNPAIRAWVSIRAVP
jgi:hypothetical protein